jgi:transmembrane sensor
MSRKLPSQERASKTEPAWDRALDWLLRTQAAPEDRRLQVEREAWLAEHPSHARAYRRAEEIWRITGAVPAHARRVRAAKWRQRIGVLAAAAFAACLILWSAPRLVPDLGIMLQADYRTGAGEVREVTLPDGTTVWLDADSAIALPADRSVSLLAGRAFFQVKSDASRPFTVTAGEERITVLGTAFDVLLSERGVTVAVQSGSVSVASGAARGVALRGGQRAIIDRAHGNLSTNAISTASVAAWRNGLLVVEGATVTEVVDELARHHSGFILLRDPALGARRITGVFDLKDPQAALRAVLKPYGGQILRITPYILIVEGH